MIDVDRGEAPASLARGVHNDEFRIELHARFLGKCYLTEQVIDATDMDVEHRHPRNDGGDDAWENLFPAAPKANLHRRRSTPDGGWLSPGEGVERRLQQVLLLDARDCTCVFAPTDPNDAAARNTADELTRLHHQVVNGGLDWSRDLRHAILAWCARIGQEAARYAVAAGDERGACEARLRSMVSRRAPFTALVRSVYPGLRHLFD